MKSMIVPAFYIIATILLVYYSIDSNESIDFKVITNN